MKLIREGMEDADYYQLMRKFNSTGALKLAQEVAGSWSSWSTSPTSIKAARLEVGNAIHVHNGGVIKYEEREREEAQRERERGEREGEVTWLMECR
jgi:hypothetical protein